MPLYPPAIQTVMDPWGTHECRLDWVSTSTVRLSRWGGQWLMINGVRQSIPAAGLDGGVASLDGNYFVWAYMLSGALALYFEGTANVPVIDPYGMPVHPLNAALTLVGLIYAPAGSMAHHGYVCSYWNRKPKLVANSVTNVQSQSTGFVNLGGNCVFTLFAGETYEAYLGGTGWGIGVDSLIVQTVLGLDGGLLGTGCNICPRFNGWYCPIGQRIALNGPAGGNGAHTIGAYGAINTNGGGAYTGQWLLNVGVRWLG